MDNHYFTDHEKMWFLGDRDTKNFPQHINSDSMDDAKSLNDSHNSFFYDFEQNPIRYTRIDDDYSIEAYFPPRSEHSEPHSYMNDKDLNKEYPEK